MHDNKLLGNYGYIHENIIQAMIKDIWTTKWINNKQKSIWEDKEKYNKSISMNKYIIIFIIFFLLY